MGAVGFTQIRPCRMVETCSLMRVRMEFRHFVLLATVAFVLGSVWAMHRRKSKSVVAAFMASGLIGLFVFSLVSSGVR